MLMPQDAKRMHRQINLAQSYSYEAMRLRSTRIAILFILTAHNWQKMKKGIPDMSLPWNW